ncbi:MAG: PAAR domain-containing protein [Minicystis sp.]
MPPASRITDLHTCPKVEPSRIPHVGGPIVTGCPTVIVGFQPQGRVGDALTCVPAVDKIATGSPTVIVGGRPAARIGDGTDHGGVIVTGFPTVILGSTAQIATLRAAAEAGIPFCEECSAGELSAPSQDGAASGPKPRAPQGPSEP